MNRLIAIATLPLVCVCLWGGQASGGPSTSAGRVEIPEGQFSPLYSLSEGEQEVSVAEFLMDAKPVTNGEFLAFVSENAAWRRGEVVGLFADEAYLSHWEGPLALGPAAGPDQPVTQVSWFAAKAFCEANGGRLPGELEWEYVAAASKSQADGRAEPIWKETILDWYARPSHATLPAVGETPANFYGVSDMHGLIWEWVLEFNSTLVSSDSRSSVSADTTRFCGAGAVAASDKSDYASFMRYAFRSSLTARYTTGSLGFRCAANKASTSATKGDQP